MLNASLTPSKHTLVMTRREQNFQRNKYLNNLFLLRRTNLNHVFFFLFYLNIFGVCIIVRPACVQTTEVFRLQFRLQISQFVSFDDMFLCRSDLMSAFLYRFYSLCYSEGEMSLSKERLRKVNDYLSETSMRWNMKQG